jgi:hypothetical protein
VLAAMGMGMVGGWAYSMLFWLSDIIVNLKNERK